jgi:hypothetical protein
MCIVHAMAGDRRTLPLPELFLGLLALSIAFVLVSHVFAATIHDARHVHDTLSVTGSAKKPINANLVRWTVTVSEDAPTAAPAARRLRVESAEVRAFLRKAGVAGAEITPSVVSGQELVEQLPHHRHRRHYHVSQQLEVSTHDIDVVEQAATRLGTLIERGVGVSAEPLEYLSTELTQAKLDALEAATNDARHRAEILVHGLGGKLASMRASSLGVYQVVPRDSTDVSDYGINDTSSREKDVIAVVSATFGVKR